MDPVMNIEPARIDELLGAYRELQSQFDRVLDRLRRAEENKHTVQRRIYDRVAGEYNRELDGLRAKMSPLRDELERVQESLETQCRSANTAIQAVEDELAEADFRHRIGEYEASDFVQLRHSLDARSEEARTRQALFQATLAAIEAMRSPALQPVSNVTPASDVAEPAPDEIALAEPEVPVVESNEPDVVVGVEAAVEEVLAAAPAASTIESAPRRPVLSARSTVAPARVDGFENPQDWISDMGGSDASRAERRRAEAPAPARKPAPSAADSIDAALTPISERTPLYPSLVFVSGAHAGQSIALLPTTLTIGREHDNNVEIKDPEVARYHARILCERGQYLVEDLSSSTGTWVNGERTQRAALSHGDVIRVGQTELALDFEWTGEGR
jgi:hypothetical protein